MTARRQSILKLRAEGNHPKRIASVLGVTVKAIEDHMKHIKAELNLWDVALLTQWALKHKIAEVVV